MKILNFGSLNMDYVYKVPHFVKPGETLSSTDREVFPGGKGLNQSVALAKSGSTVYHAGAIGGEGAFLLDFLSQAGVNTELVKTVEDSTGHAIIQVNTQGENCILLYGGANRLITEKQIDETLRFFNDGDWLVLQNEINMLPCIIQRAVEKGMKIVLNPSPFDFSIKALPLDKLEVLIVNEIEAREICGDLENALLLQKLHEKLPNVRVVLTLGAEGSMYIDKNETLSQECFKVDVVDTTAAGDTFLGYFVSGISKGESPKEALYIASKAAAFAVAKKGAATSIPTRDSLEKGQTL